MPSRNGSIFYPIILATVLSACGTSDVPNVPVAEQWADTIKNYSLLPIYPIREDVRVGDIKLTVDPSTVVSGQLPFRDIGYLDLRDAMQAYYKLRPSYPTDSKNAVPRDGSKPWVQPSSSKNLFAPDESDVKRLRMLALPSVTVATVFQASLSGQGLLGALGIGGGAAASKGRQFDISLAGLEELKAPDDFTVIKEYKKYCALELVEGRLSPKALNNSLAIMTGVNSDESKPQLAIISHVIYMRAIDYTFKTDESYAADISAVVAGFSELAKLSTALGSTSTATPSPPKDPAKDRAGTQAKEVADLVAALRAKVTGTGAPGIALSTVFVDARGVTLRDVYERPLAFAAQAVTFNYTPANVCSGSATAPGDGRVYSVSRFKK